MRVSLKQIPSKQLDKRERILEAAIRVFARKGFYDSKVSHIAKEANVADGTIYLYFHNKEDLLIHVFEESANRFIQHLRAELAKERDSAEKLRKLIAMHLDLVKHHPELAQVIQIELRSSSKFMKGYQRGKFLDYLNMIAEVIAQGQKEGIFRADLTPGFLKRVLFGMLDTIALHWVLAKKKKHPLEYYTKQVTDLVLGGLVHSDIAPKTENLRVQA